MRLAGEAEKDQPADEGLGQYVRFYNLESREEGILWDTKPSYVIMYDPDMAFIRQLEVTVSPLPLPSLHTCSQAHRLGLMLLNDNGSKTAAGSGLFRKRSGQNLSRGAFNSSLPLVV